MLVEVASSRKRTIQVLNEICVPNQSSGNERGIKNLPNLFQSCKFPWHPSLHKVLIVSSIEFHWPWGWWSSQILTIYWLTVPFFCVVKSNTLLKSVSVYIHMEPTQGSLCASFFFLLLFFSLSFFKLNGIGEVGGSEGGSQLNQPC